MSGNAGSGFDQRGRMLRIDTPLGTDAVVLTEVTGEDAISAPFAFDLTVATSQDEASVRSLLGNSVTIRLGGTQHSDGFPVNGIVRRVRGYTVDEYGLKIWHLELVPRLWLLSCIADCRIFQKKSALEIIQTILTEQNITDVDIRVPDAPPTMEYCVQYRETTLAFVSRLLERFGLFYWHEHDDGKHVLVIADSNKQANPPPGFDTVIQGTGSQSPTIRLLAEDYSYRPGTWTMTDYDFTAPRKPLQASTPTVVTEPASMASHEIYDFPGIYTDKADGEAITRMHVEIEEALFHRVQGSGVMAAFAAGQRCKAKGPEVDAEEAEFLLTQVRHRAREAAHRSGNVEPASYENEFTAVPMAVPYRHPTATPQPRMHGPQTAIVTGPSGKVLHTDEYGRVTVHFHWDRKGPDDGGSSCWIRVSQNWAGRNFGTIHLPRIGQEVIVDFLEGDPDRPIITGRVYNADNPVPYDLPANATQSGIKTHSVPNGGNNELRFEDKAGSEEIYLHAQKDFDVVVENNESRQVKADQTELIQGQMKQTVDKTVTVNVLQSVSETIGGSVTKDVTGSVTQMVGGSVTQTITGAVTQTVTGAVTQTVNGGITMTAPTVTITATSAHNVIAPASAWKTGSQSLTAFANVFQAAGQVTHTWGNRDAVVGMQVQTVGLNMAISGVNQVVNGVLFKAVSGVAMESMPTEIKTAATKILTSAMFMIL